MSGRSFAAACTVALIGAWPRGGVAAPPGGLADYLAAARLHAANNTEQRALRASAEYARDAARLDFAPRLTVGAEPLAGWVTSAAHAPDVDAATVDAADAVASRAAWRLIPSLVVGFNEHVSNAAGFNPGVGWSADVTFGWELTPRGFADTAAAEQQHAATLARLRGATEAVAGAIEDAWYRVEAARTRVIAAMTVAAASRDARVRWHS